MNVDINAIKRKLLVKYPFFGSIVANTNFEEEVSVPTAGTDGETIYYNSNFINPLTDDEKTFVFAHEVCHIAFNHLLRSEGKDQRTWNIATDSVINALLKQDGLPLVKDVVDIEEAINHDAEEMYNKLIEDQKNNQNQNKNSNSENNKENNGQASSNENSSENNTQNNKENENNQSQSNNENIGNEQQNNKEQQNEESKENTEDVGHDTHSMWQKAIEKNKQQESKETEEQKTKKEEQIEKSTELGEKYSFKQNKLERK